MNLRVILVRGVGDVGSAVAHRLFVAGFGVVLHDEPQPPTTRRGMAFADAVFDGHARLAGLDAVLVNDLATVSGIIALRTVIPVVVADLDAVPRAVLPDVIVDARMRKRVTPESTRGQAWLSIGLGPGFIAGTNVDLAIETSWDDPGRVVTVGPTKALSGEPRAIEGHGRDRYVYAPVSGIFRTDDHIGDAVTAGDPVAWIEGVPLAAPLTGVLRGLTRGGVPVAHRAKVIEVDPRGARAEVTGIGERPRRIAAGVLAALAGTPDVEPAEEPQPEQPT